MIANVSAADMPEQLKSYQKHNTIERKEGAYHAMHNDENDLSQIMLYNSGRVAIGSYWFESDSPVLVMCKENENSIDLSVSNPLHTLDMKKLILKTNLKLKPGKYQYNLKGINPQKGEYFTVSFDNNTTTIVVDLPDHSDAEKYNYQEMMYAGSPLSNRIPIQRN